MLITSPATGYISNINPRYDMRRHGYEVVMQRIGIKLMNRDNPTNIYAPLSGKITEMLYFAGKNQDDRSRTLITITPAKANQFIGSIHLMITSGLLSRHQAIAISSREHISKNQLIAAFDVGEVVLFIPLFAFVKVNQYDYVMANTALAECSEIIKSRFIEK